MRPFIANSVDSFICLSPDIYRVGQEERKAYPAIHEYSAFIPRCDATFTSANEYLAHHNEQHPSLPPDDLIVPVELPANFNIDTMLPTDGPEAARLMLEDALRTRKATHGPAGYNCPTHGLNACPITLGNQNLNLPVVVENLARIRALRGALTTVGVAIGRRRLLMDHQHKIFQYLVDVLQNMLPGEYGF